MPADLDELGGEDAGRAVVGGERLVELGHDPADADPVIDHVDLHPGIGEVQGGLDPGDPGAHHHHGADFSILLMFRHVTTSVFESKMKRSISESKPRQTASSVTKNHHPVKAKTLSKPQIVRPVFNTAPGVRTAPGTGGHTPVHSCFNRTDSLHNMLCRLPTAARGTRRRGRPVLRRNLTTKR